MAPSFLRSRLGVFFHTNKPGLNLRLSVGLLPLAAGGSVASVLPVDLLQLVLAGLSQLAARWVCRSWLLAGLSQLVLAGPSLLVLVYGYACRRRIVGIRRWPVAYGVFVGCCVLVGLGVLVGWHECIRRPWRIRCRL